MSEFLGARISLISKSDIRYVGTLASINSDDATVSLENVRSFGTEGRKGSPEDEVLPSDQIYEYIVFRGTDVKDLRIEEAAGTAKENNPPPVPNDPAIVGARPRPVNVAPGPPGPPQGPPHQGPGSIGHSGPHGGPNQHGPPGAPFGYFPPPPMGGGWGRVGGPSPGPGPGQYGGMPYPPGWFPPPGQEFPPMGPGGPGPWNNYPGPFPGGPGGLGGPGGPGGPPGFPGAPGQGRQSANQTPSNQGPSQKPAPIGPSADKKPATPSHQSQQQPEPKPVAQPSKQQPVSTGPPPPVESKPSVEEVKAKAAALNNGASTSAQDNKNIPTGPKSNRPIQILPAVPLPAALTSKVARQPQAAKPAAEQSGAPSAATLLSAAEAAKQAVAMAMASIDATAAQQATQGAAVDNLTKKVNEMKVTAARGGQSSRGGRGRGASRPTGKVEVPDSDFDFASANAKFNKQDLVKEAIAGSPLDETANGDLALPEDPIESGDAVEPAYNKSRSFFDNISSDLKDRENAAQKPGGREWRGEEQRKNMETFGQGSVDGGYRGYRGGRGRGRGGRGRGYRGGRGGNSGFRHQQQTQAPQ